MVLTPDDLIQSATKFHTSEFHTFKDLSKLNFFLLYFQFFAFFQQRKTYLILHSLIFLLTF